MGNDQIRCFIAVSLPPQIKKRLNRIQGKIREQRDLKAALPRCENLHLTLLFLGNVHLDTLEVLTSSMDAVAQSESGCFISVSQLGTFPGDNRPARILWAGIDGDVDTLKRICRKLKEALGSKGVAFDRPKFSPHVTLARFKKSPRRDQLKSLISQGDVSGETFQIKGIDLYQSELTPRGAVYTLLHRSPLR